jgi:hypothetical protein
MNVTLNTIDSTPEPALEGRWGAVVGSFLTALVVNGVIVVLLLFTTTGETRLTPPAVFVLSVPEPERPIIDPPKVERPRLAVELGGAPISHVLTISVSAPSELSMTLPDLPSIDNGVTGLGGGGSGFGSGIGSGTGFGSGDGTGSMKVGDMTVKAMRLGVILDVSGSMKEKLPEVKREVRRAFRQAKTVDVEGCRLHWKPSAESEDRKVRLKSSAGSVIEAVEMLVIDGKVDAIYWFSDLQDGESGAGLARLRELLRVGQGAARAVRFYIRTLEREPSSELAAIVRVTGGAIQAGEKEADAEK